MRKERERQRERKKGGRKTKDPRKGEKAILNICHMWRGSRRSEERVQVKTRKVKTRRNRRKEREKAKEKDERASGGHFSTGDTGCILVTRASVKRDLTLTGKGNGIEVTGETEATDQTRERERGICLWKVSEREKEEEEEKKDEGVISVALVAKCSGG